MNWVMSMISREIIYTKSDKAQKLISQNTKELTTDERRLLILIDGKRSAGEIIDKFTILENVAFHLQNLLELNLIRPLSGVSDKPAGSAQAQPAAASAKPSQLKLDEATKAFIEAEVIEFLGPMGSFVCEEAFANHTSLGDVVRQLSSEMEESQSTQFLQAVRQKLGV